MKKIQLLWIIPLFIIVYYAGYRKGVRNGVDYGKQFGETRAKYIALKSDNCLYGSMDLMRYNLYVTVEDEIKSSRKEVLILKEKIASKDLMFNLRLRLSQASHRMLDFNE